MSEPSQEIIDSIARLMSGTATAADCQVEKELRQQWTEKEAALDPRIREAYHQLARLNQEVRHMSLGNVVLWGPGTLQYELAHPKDPLLKRAVDHPESITPDDLQEMVRLASAGECPSLGRPHVPSGPWRWEDVGLIDTEGDPIDLADAGDVDYILGDWFLFSHHQGRWCQNEQCCGFVEARTLTGPQDIARGARRYSPVLNAVFPRGWRKHPTVLLLLAGYKEQLAAAGGDISKTKRWDNWFEKGVTAPPVSKV